jgi:uncharacterized protein (TIGR01777 family)
MRHHPSVNILITGATGMVGEPLVARLVAAGHTVRFLTRSPDRARIEGATAFGWDPAGGEIDEAALDGVDAVIHLAGENIAGGRWTEARKRRIHDSRVEGTDLVARRLAARPESQRPAVLLSASAVGIYGDRGSEILQDDSEPGTGFLADVATAWEKAADPARDAGIRVVHPRIGVVLDRSGGALGAMLTPFRLGLGGVVGPGTQWMSWISLADLLGILVALLDDATFSGPVAAVAPSPVTNREFTRTLGRVLRRPTILPLPSFAARLVLGEMADHLLLASTRVEPRALLQRGHEFEHPTLEMALRAALA